MNIRLLSVAILMCALAAKPAGAECKDNKYRPLRPDETKHFKRLYVLRDTFPGTLDKGWQFEEGGDLYAADARLVPDKICADHPERFYPIVVDLKYKRAFSGAEADAELASVKSQAGDSSAPAGPQDIVAKQKEIAAKMQTAAQKQDFAEIDRLSKQMQALTDKQTRAQNDAATNSRDSLKKFQGDRRASIHVQTSDPVEETCYGMPKKLDIAGATAYLCSHPDTFRQNGDLLNPATSRAVVFLGRVTAAVHAWEWLDRQGGSHKDHYVALKTAVDWNRFLDEQNGAVLIESDNAPRVESLLKKLNLKGLEAIVTPLP